VTKNKYTVGLIGCGRIAKVHAEAITQIEEFSIQGVCDIKPEKRNDFASRYGTPAYSDFKSLLQNEKPDIITIATPNGTHYPIAKECFNQGFNVLLEKPVAIEMKDGEELVALAEKKNLHFFAVKQVRYNPTIRMLKSAINKGKLGKLLSSSLVVRWARPQEYFDQTDWRGTKDQDGGTLLNQGIHYVDIMQWLMGDVHSVFGKTNCCCHQIEIEDMALGFIQYTSGALGTLEFTINTYPHNMECSITVLGEKGSVKLAGSAMNEIEIWEVRDTPKPVVPEGFPPYVYEGGLYQGSCPNHLFVYLDILKVFHGQDSHFVDGKEALRSLRIVNGLYQSSRLGKEAILKVHKSSK